MNIERISQILITTEDLVVKAGTGFIYGAIFTFGGKIKRWEMGLLGAISQLAKSVLSGLIQFLGKTLNLKPSTIQFLKAGTNLLYDAAYIISLIALGYITFGGVVGYTAIASLGFYINFKAARIQRVVDYPFTSNNFTRAAHNEYTK